MAAGTSDIRQLLGLAPSSVSVLAYLSSLSSHLPAAPGTIPLPDVKSYPDAVYFNYYHLGLSLLFVPTNGYRPQTNLKRDDLRDEDLLLDGIDIYNISNIKAAPSLSTSSTYSSYPVSPVVISVSAQDKDGKARQTSQLSIHLTMTGKDFVSTLGEPDRKGGGAGPSSGNIGIWLEWSKDGLMVEYGGDESRGPKAWETGKDAVWRVLSIFPPKSDH